MVKSIFLWSKYSIESLYLTVGMSIFVMVKLIYHLTNKKKIVELNIREDVIVRITFYLNVEINCNPKVFFKCNIFVNAGSISVE